MTKVRGITSVVSQLRKERSSLEVELKRVDAALSVLGKLNGRSSQPKRTLSAAARRKIAAAQRARWARVKAAAKKAA